MKPIKYYFIPAACFLILLTSVNPVISGKYTIEDLEAVYYEARTATKYGDFDSAVKFFEKGVEICESMYGENHDTTVTFYQNLGDSYYSQGNYERAQYYVEKAYKITTEMSREKTDSAAACLGTLGKLYLIKGDYNKAIGYFEKMLRILLELHGEKNRYTMVAYSYLGAAYLDINDYNHSLKYNEKALKISIEVLGEKHPDTAVNYSNLGVAYASAGNNSDAIKNYEKALKACIYTYGDDHPTTAGCYSNLGMQYFQKKDYDTAIEYYDKSLRGYRKIGEKHPDIAQCHYNLGEAYLGKKDYINCIKNLEKALSIVKETEANQQTVDYSRKLGNLYFSAKNFQKAYSYYLTGVERIEKVRKMNLSGGKEFTSRNIDLFYSIITASYMKNDTSSMLIMSERMHAMGFLERLSLKNAVKAGGIKSSEGSKLLRLKDEIEKLSALRQKYISASEYSMNETQKKAHHQQFETTNRDLAKAESDFNRLDAGFMNNEKYKLLRDTNVLSVKDAQKLCSGNDAIIEYIIPEFSQNNTEPYAIIIMKNRVEVVRLDRSFNFPENIEKFRAAVKNDNRSSVESLSVELYKVLIEPVEMKISSSDIDSLLIVTDGSLAFLPFDAVKSKNGKYLSEKYNLSLTPSVSIHAITMKRKYGRHDNLIAFGGGLYAAKGDNKSRDDRSFRGIEIVFKEKEKIAGKAFNTPFDYYSAQKLNWSDLPGTEREVLAIDEKVYRRKNTLIYTSAKVTEKNFKAMSESGQLNRYTSIHLACHGYYDPEFPAYSAVVFSEVSGKIKNSTEDGYMSVEETALLNLQSDIVVLSACETGLGRMIKGDGIIGLTRSFLVAGSNRVLVTLWPVNDDATEEFMVSFYSKIKAGESYRKALDKTKDEFRRSAGYSSPYFWAGFVLYE